MSLILYDYWRSSASYRVRIALHLKGLDYAQQPIHLLRDGGQQHTADYRRLNPQRLIPTLVHGSRVLTQSLAIIEYLEETFPEPALLPTDATGRARVRAIAQSIACDIHPLNNLRVLRYLVQELDVGEERKLAWYRHWVDTGLSALEQQLAGHADTGTFCHGEQPGLADCCLLPQLYNARRFDCDTAGWPTLERIAAALDALPAVRRAAPENQPDAE